MVAGGWPPEQIMLLFLRRNLTNTWGDSLDEQIFSLRRGTLGNILALETHTRVCVTWEISAEYTHAPEM